MPSMQTLQTFRRSAVRPFAHLLSKAKKTAPRDSGPTSDGDEVDSGPTQDDEIENEPNAQDDDDDEDDESALEEREKDEKAVQKALAAGHRRALKAVARRERTRSVSVLRTAHANGRIELAADLLLSTNMSMGAIIDKLWGSPRNFTMTPGQSLVQAAQRLANEMPGQNAMPPQLAAESARIHKIERAEAMIKAQRDGNVEAGLGLLKACAALPPKPRLW